MPSVVAAAMNTAEASNSFSPFWLLKRLLEIIQISRGMLRMRISVMELGRFTLLGGSPGSAGRLVDYPPREWGTQCNGWDAWDGSMPSRHSLLRLCWRRQSWSCRIISALPLRLASLAWR